jgi:flagellar biosynthetic protein FliP
MPSKNTLLACALTLVVAALLIAAAPTPAFAAAPQPAGQAQAQAAPRLDLKVDNVGSVSAPLQIVILLTLLTFIPAILVTMTSFTRIVIVFHFLRQALGTQEVPSNQILATPPVRDFMLKQTREKDLAVFVELGKLQKPQTPDELPMRIVIPAFVISELKTGFQMGFFLFVPFLLIDLVVSTTLLSMGMMQLPPAMISLPFKVMLFVMIDGWNLLVVSVVRSFA